LSLHPHREPGQAEQDEGRRARYGRWHGGSPWPGRRGSPKQSSQPSAFRQPLFAAASRTGASNPGSALPTCRHHHGPRRVRPALLKREAPLGYAPSPSGALPYIQRRRGYRSLLSLIRRATSSVDR
jgi:hypothetical protein